VQSLKCGQICEVLLVWLGENVVQLKFGGSYFLAPGIHSPIAHPCRGLLRLQMHDFEVDVVVVEQRLGVGS
jgi:hypothetical protein